MPFDQIETQKRQYTDKYVVVDPTRPELARFRNAVGKVKTVNMSGRALVEFMDYHLNIGWYDIDPAFLKIVDKPAPEAATPEGKKPVAKPEAKPAVAAKTPAAKAPAAAAAKAGKPSVADILAAARTGKAAAKAHDGTATSVAVKATSEAAPAAAPAPAAAIPAPVDRSKMSVADMIAAARGGGAGGAAAAKPQAAPPPAKPQAAATPVEVETPAEEAAAESAPAAPPPKSTEKVDRSKMTVADMLAWCRAHDSK